MTLVKSPGGRELIVVSVGINRRTHQINTLLTVKKKEIGIVGTCA
ncbi:MAG: hypothetical protein ABSB80_04415 [Methanoregula sp.]|jgi:hypothetical protein